MRKLTLALMTLACFTTAAHAQQQPKSTVDQGAAGGAPWPVSWTGQSVLADLRVGGIAVTAANPVPTLNVPGTSVIGRVGIDQTTPGSTNATASFGTDGTTQRQVSTTTTGALAPPVAAAGKIVETQVALTASTSTQLVAANVNRIAMEIQCDGAAPIAIGRTGTALTGLTGGLIIPAGLYPLYTPPIPSLTAITAWSASAQTCRTTEYLR